MPIKPSGEDIEAFGLMVEETHNDDGEREFIRVGIWREDYRYSSQLGPMISNTIISQRIGEASPEDEVNERTEVERIFEMKLREYSLEHASSNVSFPVSDKKTSMQHGADVISFREAEIEEDPYKFQIMDHRMIQCSLLPHFSSSEWSTISLV
jgi:hypothetical protein